MTSYTAGDMWEEHYRGYELRINADRDVWWQVYNGTDRLHLEPKPTELVDQFLELKPLGGRVRVTDGGTVITRQADESAEGSRSSTSIDDYTAIYVGEIDLRGDLVPTEKPEYSVPVRPDGLTTGDLWPSVYDGARYSFSMDGNVWWHNPRTKKRHPIADDLPESVSAGLQRVKPEGGSFRVTPWGDVITLVRSPATQTVKDQFGDLPRVIRNIIKLRRERADLQMIPVYVAQLDDLPLSVTEPSSITDQLSAEEQDALEGWAASLGSTTTTDAESHTRSRSEEANSDASETEAWGADEGTHDDADVDDELPMDDPVAWLSDDMDRTEERINDR
jgi:hypothetical protein